MIDITLRMRSRIAALLEHCNYTQTAFAKIVGISQKSVFRIVNQHKTTGSVSPTRKEK